MGIADQFKGITSSIRGKASDQIEMTNPIWIEIEHLTLFSFNLHRDVFRTCWRDTAIGFAKSLIKNLKLRIDVETSDRHKFINDKGIIHCLDEDGLRHAIVFDAFLSEFEQGTETRLVNVNSYKFREILCPICEEVAGLLPGYAEYRAECDRKLMEAPKVKTMNATLPAEDWRELLSMAGIGASSCNETPNAQKRVRDLVDSLKKKLEEEAE